MCGGCPGGSVISPLSAHVTLRGIKAQVTRELSSRCAPNFRVGVFGDSWVVTGATGKQTVCASIEDAAFAVVGAVCVAGMPAAAAQILLNVDAPTVDSGMSGILEDGPRSAIVTEAATTTLIAPGQPLAPRLTGVPSFPDPGALTPSELVDCLLWFAATHPVALLEHPLPPKEELVLAPDCPGCRSRSANSHLARITLNTNHWDPSCLCRCRAISGPTTLQGAGSSPCSIGATRRPLIV